MVLGQLAIHMQKNEAGLLPYYIQKINPKWISKIRSNTIKFYKKTKVFDDIGLSNAFLYMTSKAQRKNR